MSVDNRLVISISAAPFQRPKKAACGFIERNIIKMTRIAIVGTGIIAGCHIDAISKLEDCTLVALCDLNEERVKALAEKNGVPYFLDYKKIPEECECDAVILNLPHGIHAEASIFFLEHGIHVLVEKPMANTVAECDAMIAASEKSGKKLAVAHVQRYFRPNRIVKELVDSGELGKLCMYSEQRSINYFLPNRPAWFTSKKMAGGGIVMNYGAHAFDKLFYITGKEPTAVYASTANLINDKDVEGHAQIFAKFEDGLSAVVTFSGYSDVVYESIYYFTGGAVKVLGVDRAFIRREGDSDWTEIDAKRDGREFALEVDDFCKYTRGEESTIPDGKYSRAIIKTIEEAYNS